MHRTDLYSRKTELVTCLAACSLSINWLNKLYLNWMKLYFHSCAVKNVSILFQ